MIEQAPIDELMSTLQVKLLLWTGGSRIWPLVDTRRSFCHLHGFDSP